ncbi:MAG: hypothetical protein AAGF12_34640 [Myxococcota bacterium]
MEEKGPKLAIAGLVIGMLAIAAGACIAPCGPLLALFGIGCCVFGLQGDRRRVAIIGMVLNVVAVFVSLGNIFLGLYMIESGMHPLYPNGIEGGVQWPPPRTAPANPPADPAPAEEPDPDMPELLPFEPVEPPAEP